MTPSANGRTSKGKGRGTLGASSNDGCWFWGFMAVAGVVFRRNGQGSLTQWMHGTLGPWVVVMVLGSWLLTLFSEALVT